MTNFRSEETRRHDGKIVAEVVGSKWSLSKEPGDSHRPHQKCSAAIKKIIELETRADGEIDA
jgi:hypothetical protein